MSGGCPSSSADMRAVEPARRGVPANDGPVVRVRHGLSDLPAVCYIRAAPTTTDEAARQVERQHGQIAPAADRLGLLVADEFVDVGYLRMSMDRPDLRRLLDHVAADQTGATP